MGRNLPFSNNNFLICRKLHPGTPNAHVTASQQSHTDLLTSWAGGSSDEEGGGISGQHWALVTAISLGEEEGKKNIRVMVGEADGEELEGKGEAWLKAVGATSRYQPVAKIEVLQTGHSRTGFSSGQMMCRLILGTGFSA